MTQLLLSYVTGESLKYLAMRSLGKTGKTHFPGYPQGVYQLAGLDKEENGFLWFRQKALEENLVSCQNAETEGIKEASSPQDWPMIQLEGDSVVSC